MTLIIDENPYRPGYFIHIKGMRDHWEAANDKELLLAVAHHFRPEGADPRHWGNGVPNCPFCV